MVWLLLAPSLAIFFLYRIVPLGWNAVLSVQKWSPLRPAEFAGLYHYEEMFFHDDVFWTSLKNTLVYMASAPVGIALALALALLVNAGIRGRTVYRAVIFASYPLMTVAVGIIWRWLYDEKLGLINYALIRLGVVERGIPLLVGVAQERAWSWAPRKLRRGRWVHFTWQRKSICVNHYYIYVLDPDWGPAFIKVCGYAPYALKLGLNGHEWAKRQLQRRH